MRKPNKYTDVEKDAHREQCWSLFCRGYNYTAIAEEVGVHRHTVRSYVDYMREETKKHLATGDEMAEILRGYKETLKAAWQLHKETDSQNAKVGAIGRVQDGLKAIAGMFGVSTAKVALQQSVEVEHSGGVVIESEQMGEIARVLSECGALKIDEEE